MSGQGSLGGWRLVLGEGQVLRQGVEQDRWSLLWLVRVSRWVHRVQNQESLRSLLAYQPSIVWQRGSKLHGALLTSFYRRPVATVRLLALRAREDRSSFFAEVLSHAEERFAALGARWLSFYDCPPWLEEALPGAGYIQQDLVLNYVKTGLEAPCQGNSQVLVRRPTLEDVPGILTLDRAAFEPFWWINAEIVRRSIWEAPYCLIAEYEGEVVGYLIAEERWRGRAYLSRIGVLPSWQSRGVGTRLMVEAFAEMRRDGLRGVLLNTQAKNLQAQAFYQRLGFFPTGEGTIFWSKELPANSNPT